MGLHDKLSIVIPCKNEKRNIQTTLDLLNYQNNIDGVKVIVSDNSNDGVTKPDLWDRLEQNSDRFNLHLMDGGLPSIARNNGFKLVTTPYVLFLDADIFLLDNTLIQRAITHITKNDLDMVTTKFKTTSGEYNIVYDMFTLIQRTTKYISPFCLGGFMLISSDKFREIGGFDQEILVAEDYQLSRKIKPSKFEIIDKVVYTTPRRFKNKGMFYMVNLFIKSFIHRDNKNYFRKDNGYWK